MALEDFENGIKSYQSALRVNARHYNSWYGLGMIYLRQEKFEFSEHHFRMAFKINQRSSVIMSYLGTALDALRGGSLAPFILIQWLMEAILSLQALLIVFLLLDREVTMLWQSWRRLF